jgi:hypothetical protein
VIKPPEPTPWKEKTLIEKMMIIGLTLAGMIVVSWFLIEEIKWVTR